MIPVHLVWTVCRWSSDKESALKHKPIRFLVVECDSSPACSRYNQPKTYKSPWTNGARSCWKVLSFVSVSPRVAADVGGTAKTAAAAGEGDKRGSDQTMGAQGPKTQAGEGERRSSFNKPNKNENVQEKSRTLESADYADISVII